MKTLIMSKQKQQTPQTKSEPIKVEIEVITPIIAPNLSSNKEMKKLQIQDIKKCYDEKYHDIVDHLDRAFDRDSSCNVIFPTSILSAALRNQYPEIVVRGIVLFPKDSVRIGTKKVADGLMNYEYIASGTKTYATLLFSQEVKFPVILQTGARKLKGYGLIKLSAIS